MNNNISLLITILLIAYSYNSFACSCSKITPFFGSVKYAKIVVEGKVIEHKKIKATELDFGYSAVLFQVAKIYNGKIKNDTILIAESIGYECYNSYFKNGKSYLIHGDYIELHNLNAKSKLIVSNKILIPSSCTVSTLQINNQEICGKISINPNKFNLWFYKLSGKLRQIKSKKRSHYIECMSIDKIRARLTILKFKN